MSLKGGGWIEQSGDWSQGHSSAQRMGHEEEPEGDSGGLGGQGTPDNAASWKPRGFSGKGSDCVKGCEKVASYESRELTIGFRNVAHLVTFNRAIRRQQYLPPWVVAREPRPAPGTG